MKDTISKLKKIYFAAFAVMALFAAIIYVLKSVLNYADFVELHNKIAMGVMILILAIVAGAVFAYSFIAKKSKELDSDQEEQQVKLYYKASIIKIALIEAAGVISGIMCFIKYQKSYLYMIGIVLVFILIFLPSEMNFKKDFKSRSFE